MEGEVKKRRRRRRTRVSSTRSEKVKNPPGKLRRLCLWIHDRLAPLAYILTLVYLFTIPFEKAVVIEGVGTVSKLAGIPLLAIWVLLKILKPDFRRMHAFHWVSLGYVLVCGMTYFWSMFPDRTTVMFNTYIQLYLATLFIWYALINEDRCIQALVCYLLGSSVVVGFIYYNFATGNVTQYSGRTTVADTDPNETALVLSLGLPVAWYLVTRIGSFDIKAVVMRLLCFAYIPAAVVAMVMTGSRGGVLSTVPTVLYILITFSKFPLPFKVVVSIFIAIAIYLALPYLPEQQLERIATTTSQIDTGEVSGRGDLWKDAFALWFSEPLYSLVGIGVGSFFTVSGGFVAHSVHVGILVETGLLGMLAYLSILLALGIACLRCGFSERYFLLALLMCWFIGASALSWEYRKPTWVIWSLIVCIATVSYQKKKNSQNKKTSQNKRTSQNKKIRHSPRR